MSETQFHPGIEPPDNGRTVLIYTLLTEGKRAGSLLADLGTYVRPHTVPDHGDLDDGFVEYNPDDDQHYCREGWYRSFDNEHGEEIVMPMGDAVEMWAEIPMPEVTP